MYRSSYIHYLIRNHMFLISLFYFICFASFAEKVSLPPKSSTQTFTFYDISKIETAKLLGNQPSYEFYIPIPITWDVNELNISLVVQFSKIMIDSSLTVLVNNIPIDTIKLDNKSPQPILWKFKIPKRYINKELITLRIIGEMRVTNDICADRENPGNWITLSGNSSVTYDYNKIQPNLSIVKFPSPFIQKNSPFIDTIALVLPDNLNSENFGLYFMVVNFLSKHASWRGLDFAIKSFSESIKTPGTHPSILIGLADQFDFSKIGIPNHMQIKDGKWLYLDGTPLSQYDGFVWLTQYKGQPFLIISANTYKGIHSAIRAIYLNTMHYLSTYSDFYIAKPKPQTKKEKPTIKKVSLTDLGYNDIVIFGTGENQRTFQFNLPHDYVKNPVTFTLNYSNSPFLEPSKISSITCSINDLPINGIVIKPDITQKNTFKITLPQSQLKIGKNNLTITFSLNMRDASCSRDYLNQIWAIIYANSYFEFQMSTEPSTDELKNYPEMTNGEVLVALPSEPAVYKDTQILNELIKFSKSLSHTEYLNVVSQDSVLSNELNYDIVSLSTHNDNSTIVSHIEASFMNLINNLNLTSSSVLKMIDKSIFIDAFIKEQGIGFAMISFLSKNTKHSNHLMLYGYSSEDLKIILSLLNNKYKRDSLSGDMAVAFSNGTYTSLSINDIDQHVQTEVAVEKMSRITVILFIGVIISIALFIAVFFIWRKKRL